jgi:NTP pyrophosphatase (non-canonical NTP hydrolase)
MDLTDKQFDNLHKVVLLCMEENTRQLNKWGIQTRTPFEWLAYTTEELGELAKAMSEHYYRDGNVEDVIKEAVQTATLVLKIAEMYSTMEDKKDARHDVKK